MRLPLYVALLMILLIVAGLMFDRFMAAEADRIVDALRGVEEAVLEGRFDDAEAQLTQIEQQWQRTDRIWCVVVDHYDMDRVKESLVRLRQHIRFHDAQWCVVELAFVIYAISHIPLKESLSLESVL